MENKLIPMTDFVLAQRMASEEVAKASFFDIQTHIYKYYDKIYAYAQFINQLLKPWMFVPCDEDGNVLEKPTRDNFLTHGICRTDDFTKALKEYEKAKERVLFKGFELEGNYLMYHGFMYSMIYELETKTIESIIDAIPNNPLQLTPTALKQIYG